MCVLRGRREHFDRPVRRRLTGEGVADVSAVKTGGGIANTEDGDGWKEGCMSARGEEKAL